MKKKQIIIIGALASVVLAGVGYWYYQATQKTLAPAFKIDFFKSAVADPKTGVQTSVRSSLTGQTIDQATANLRPMAVMIENLADTRSPMNGSARPQAGLNKADVVYETLAEGGITRFMPVFQSQTATRIMPVRSARPYYVSWAAEYNAAYFHVGGSPEGLDLASTLARAGKLFDGGGVGGWYLRFQPWLSERRAIEHTAYTDSEKLRAVLSRQGAEKPSTFEPWLFKDATVLEKRPASKTSLEIAFLSLSQNLYSVRWEYDQTTNLYKRFMAGVAHIDQVSGEQLTASNIIVQRVTNGGNLPSGHSRQDIRVVGNGAGFLLRDGQVYPIKWSKVDHSAKTAFTMEDGTPIVLSRGQTWVEVPTQDSTVVTR